MSGFDRRSRNFAGLAGLGIAAGLALTVIGAIVLRDDRTYDLRWKLPPGKVLTYRTSVSTQYPASRFTWQHTSRYLVRDGNPTLLECTMKKVLVGESDATGDWTWDSAMTPTPPDQWLARMAATGLGKPFTFRMDERGRATERHGERELAEASMREFPLGMMFRPFEGTEYGSPILSLEFPSRPVPVGFRWTAETETRLGIGTSRRVERFVLKEVQGGVAVIEGELLRTSTTFPSGEKASSLRKAAEAVPEPKIVEKSTYRFSLEEGHLLLMMRRLQVEGSLSGGKPFGYTMTDETSMIGGE